MPKAPARMPDEGKIIHLTEAGLPSPHQSYANVVENRLRVMEADFNMSLGSIDAEIEGQQRAYEDAKTVLENEFKIKLAELASTHDGKKSDLLRTRDDLIKGHAIVTAGLDKAAELTEAPDAPIS